MEIVTRTDIKEFPLASRGKVRDIYELPDDRLLIVTCDRISAFDVVLPNPIPYKGVVLNSITIYWMEKMADLVDNHILVSDVADYPEELAPYAPLLEGRSVIVRRADPLPVECIVRGFITGSGWKDYRATGAVSGHELPSGLVESQQLPQPLFTPSTKAEQGEHDENITVDAATALLGPEDAARVEELSLAIYARARDMARDAGIIIADTKFEFGRTPEGIILIDEVLTPDSSRFWPEATYEPGRSQPSFDKQFVRDYLVEIGFDKSPPGPDLPPQIVEETRKKYFQIYERLTGHPLAV